MKLMALSQPIRKLTPTELLERAKAQVKVRRDPCHVIGGTVQDPGLWYGGAWANDQAPAGAESVKPEDGEP